MAEALPKRPREESLSDSIDPPHTQTDDDSKRHKPLNTILNFLENEEDDADDDLSHDLTAIFTTLQQELSSSSPNSPTTAQASDPSRTLAGTGSDSAECGGDEDETAKSVMRHLLEASDDELGIPNRREDENCFEVIGSGENLGFNFGDNGGLWELEDEAANYYTVLQAEFFDVGNLGD